ncbi:MAG: hypothetical protein ACLFPM_07120, partial [Candidatus Izemoplasmatales bacterium]
GQKQSIDVIKENGQLYASFSWFKYVEMHMINENQFELLSFPMYFQYDFDDHTPKIKVSGNYGSIIMGRTLYKLT